MKVKICGMMSPRDIAICADADALGFVTEYPQDVPWNLSVSKTADLMAYVPAGVIKFMVTGGLPEKIIALAKRIKPDVVQLQHEETISEITETAAYLSALGIHTVKALRIDEKGNLLFEAKSIPAAAQALEAAGIDAILIDSATPDRPGGTGRMVSIEAYQALKQGTKLPVILAGGLRADNLAKIVSAAGHPCMVDVLTGVEASPGIKDEKKVAAFINAAKWIREETQK